MPLIIIDYLKEDYTINHGGLLRKYLEQELRYVEGQVLEVYEGWLGREKTRMVNARVTALIDHKKIYLPRDTVLKYGVVPRTWVVFSAIRVGDPRRDVYYPVYPGRVVPYAPSKNIVLARIEDLMLRMTGLSSFFAGLIYRGLEVVRESKRTKEKT